MAAIAASRLFKPLLKSNVRLMSTAAASSSLLDQMKATVLQRINNNIQSAARSASSSAQVSDDLMKHAQIEIPSVPFNAPKEYPKNELEHHYNNEVTYYPLPYYTTPDHQDRLRAYYEDVKIERKSPSLIKEYGLFPIAASALTVAVGHELLVLDPEAAYPIILGIAGTILYCQIAGIVDREGSDKTKKEQEIHVASAKALIEQHKLLIRSLKASKSIPEVFTNIYLYQDRLMARFPYANERRFLRKLNTSIIEKLDAVASSDAKLIADMREVIDSAASEYVFKSFQQSNIQQQFFAESLSHLKAQADSVKSGVKLENVTATGSIEVVPSLYLQFYTEVLKSVKAAREQGKLPEYLKVIA